MPLTEQKKFATFFLGHFVYKLYDFRLYTLIELIVTMFLFLSDAAM